MVAVTLDALLTLLLTLLCVGITELWALLLGVAYSACSIVVSIRASRQQSSRNYIYIWDLRPNG
jgi:hypothetical protein